MLNKSMFPLTPLRIAIVTYTIFAATILVDSANAADEDEPLADSLTAFEGHENWPTKTPDDLDMADSPIHDQRIIFDAQFPGSQGLGGPLENTTMIFDAVETYFKGRPALLIQWSSTGQENGDPGTGSIDSIVVDRESHRTLHRVQSLGSMLGPPTWAGPIAVTNYQQDTILRTTILEDGSAEPVRLDQDNTGTIDFAALPLWLPFLELEEGMKFQVPYFRASFNDIGRLPIHVKGRENVPDARGGKQSVWIVQVMSPGGAAVTEFWVSDKSPYFYGWTYQLANGKYVSKMWYRQHWDLAR